MGSFTRGIAEGAGQAIGLILILGAVLFLIVLAVYWGVKTGVAHDIFIDTIKKTIGL